MIHVRRHVKFVAMSAAFAIASGIGQADALDLVYLGPVGTYSQQATEL
jgi:hypothetical protein